MKHEHSYQTTVTWTGNRGTGTSGYGAYDRSHTISILNKADISGSSDPAFRGDKTKINPEEMLVSSISTCHMLWYLHLCADNGITVISYQDHAIGTMQENENGGGRFTEVTLQPVVTITNHADISRANELHIEANKKCFISASCNFPIHHRPTCIVNS
jgi:organic hydroperoxide reductase OsmC/OhrA